MKRWQRSIVQKYMKCLFCSHILIIWRIKGRNRKSGHIKHIYCFVCRRRTPHEESSLDLAAA